MAQTKTPSAKKVIVNPDAGSNRMFMFAIIGILVLGLAGIAFVATQRDAVDFDGEQTAEVELDGDLLLPMPGSGVSADPAADAAIGQPLPTLTGTGFNDEQIVIEDDGRAKVIYFLAHWCPHCQAEVPRLVELIDSGAKPDDLDIYGVSTSVDASRGGAYPPAAWFDREGFDVPVIRDSPSNDAFNFFGGGGFPYAVYVDADNNIVARSSGELEPSTIQNIWEITAGVTDGEIGSE